MTPRQRLVVPGALAALAAAAAVQAAQSMAFTTQCELKSPAATCACLANQLQQSRDGQVVLDTFEASALPAEQRRTAQDAMLKRYNLTEADLGPIGNAAPALLTAARKACE